MKCEFHECEGCFEFSLLAETKEDVVFNARFALNATKEIRSKGALFQRDGGSKCWVVLGKRKESTASL